MIKGCMFFLAFVISLKTNAQVNSAYTNRDSNMVKQFFFAGLREKLADNYVGATADFNKVLSMDPANHAAYFELANASLRQDRLNEAASNIKQAVKLNPDNKWYLRLMAEVYKRTDKMPELITVLVQLIRLEPDNVAYYFDKANAQFISGKADDAEKTYNEIEQKFGESRELKNARRRFQQNDNTNDSDIVKLLEGNKADIKNYLYAAGLLLQKNNDVEALKVLQKARNLAPDNFEVNLMSADIYRKQKNDEAAFNALKAAFESAEMPLLEKEKIIAALLQKIKQPAIAVHVTELSKLIAEKNPADIKALELYGDVLYQQNKLKEALVQYQSALKLDGQVYAVWEQIINIHTLSGQYAEALKAADEALAIYPNQASLYYYTAYAQYKTGRYEPAQKNLTTAIQLDAENKSLLAQVYALQGDIYINQNNFAQAKAAFEKAISAEPGNYLIMNNYAYYLALKNDDLQKAAGYAETAANAMPENASVADTYAFILFKQQKYDLAKTWIEKALQNNGHKNGVYLERYGDILFLRGDKEAALGQWLKAKEAGNGSEVLNKKINEKKYFK